jgi:DNA-binding NtrC family response regulator
MTQQLALVFGTSCAIRRVLAEASMFAASRYPVLILGEPGTGKTALARHLHELSCRPGPFVQESAAAIPEHIEISHLTGHAQGAFTGAVRHQPGLIESAHGGTFFLDELGAASSKVQEVLLHLLERGSLRRVGESRDRPVDVRFVAATNSDLAALAACGKFRRDLLDRFGYLTITMPKLADRRDEILPLADVFLQGESATQGQPERPLLSDEVRAALLAAPWVGNIRELRDVCHYAVLSARMAGLGHPIDICDLPPAFIATLGDLMQCRHDRSAAERAREALTRAGGNKARAARLLGISRQQLYRLLRATSVIALGATPIAGHRCPAGGRHALHAAASHAPSRTPYRTSA